MSIKQSQSDSASGTVVSATDLDIRDLAFASDKVDASGTILGTGTNAIGKLASNSGVDIGDVDITSIATGDNNIGNVDVVTIPGIVGTIADDSTTPGAPVMVGGKAVETDNTDPTSVSGEDDVAILRTDRNRRLLVNTRHPNGFRGNENNATAQTANPIVAAPGASLSLYITDIIISNGATAGTCLIMEDTAGAATTLLGPYYFAINGGMSKSFQTPIRVTANKDIGYTSVTVTTMTVTVIGYTAP